MSYTDKLDKLLDAVEKLPPFPSNLANATIKKGDEIVSYGPHDPFRVEQEQIIVAAIRADLIYQTVGDGNSPDKSINIGDDKLTEFVKNLLSKPTAGENKNDENAISQRVSKLSEALCFGVEEDIKYLYATGKKLEFDMLQTYFRGEDFFKTHEKLNDVFSSDILIERPNGFEVIELQKRLMEKGYQIDRDSGTLHSISNERQYVNGQNLADLTDNFNSFAAKDELEKKAKFYDEYFANLSKSGIYKNKTEITIMDIGTENGDLTSQMADAALKNFPDHKINIIAVDRTQNFVEKCTEKFSDKLAENDGRLTYTPVVNHYGDSAAPAQLQGVANVDMFLVTDVRNFNAVHLVNESANYAADNAIILMKHSNNNDLGAKIGTKLGPDIARNTSGKAEMIEKDLAGAGIENLVTAEFKASFGFGMKGFSDDDKQAIHNIEYADFQNKVLHDDPEKLKKLRLVEFLAGAPVAAFKPEHRDLVIEAFNQELSQGFAILSSGCQLVSAKNKELQPEQVNAFNEAIAAINPTINTDRSGKEGGWAKRHA